MEDLRRRDPTRYQQLMALQNLQQQEAQAQLMLLEHQRRTSALAHPKSAGQQAPFAPHQHHAPQQVTAQQQAEHHAQVAAQHLAHAQNAALAQQQAAVQRIQAEQVAQARQQQQMAQAAQQVVQREKQVQAAQTQHLQQVQAALQQQNKNGSPQHNAARIIAATQGTGNKNAGAAGTRSSPLGSYSNQPTSSASVDTNTLYPTRSTEASLAQHAAAANPASLTSYPGFRSEESRLAQQQMSVNSKNGQSEEPSFGDLAKLLRVSQGADAVSRVWNFAFIL